MNSDEKLYLFDNMPLRKDAYFNYIYQFITGRKLTEIYHSHNFSEIIYMVEGSCVQRINETDVVFKRQDLLFLRPGDRHSFIKQTDDMACFSLSVRQSEFERMAEMMNPVFASEIRSAVSPPLLRLSEPFPIPRYETGEIAASSTVYDCMLLMTCLFKLYADNRQADRSMPLMLEHAVQEMQNLENLCRGIDAFTALTSYSRTHLARLIHKHYGMTLKQFINDLRLKQAYRDLVLTSRCIDEIAESLGFFSSSHFSRIFKEHFGITPAALRRHKGFFTI